MAATPACRSAAIYPTAPHSSMSISPAARGVRGRMPTGSKLTLTMRRGDLFCGEVAGGGGWGGPLERDPALVLRGVLNEFISERAARGDYGVVLAGKPLTIDAAATKALREQLRTQRK